MKLLSFWDHQQMSGVYAQAREVGTVFRNHESMQHLPGKTEFNMKTKDSLRTSGLCGTSSSISSDNLVMLKHLKCWSDLSCIFGLVIETPTVACCSVTHRANEVSLLYHWNTVSICITQYICIMILKVIKSKISITNTLSLYLFFVCKSRKKEATKHLCV